MELLIEPRAPISSKLVVSHTPRLRKAAQGCEGDTTCRHNDVDGNPSSISTARSRRRNCPIVYPLTPSVTLPKPLQAIHLSGPSVIGQTVDPIRNPETGFLTLGGAV